MSLALLAQPLWGTSQPCSDSPLLHQLPPPKPLLLQLTTDSATHAASALARLAPRLPDAELVELATDMLCTLGLRPAAWTQIIGILAEHGGSQVSKVA